MRLDRRLACRTGEGRAVCVLVFPRRDPERQDLRFRRTDTIRRDSTSARLTGISMALCHSSNGQTEGPAIGGLAVDTLRSMTTGSKRAQPQRVPDLDTSAFEIGHEFCIAEESAVDHGARDLSGLD